MLAEKNYIKKVIVEVETTSMEQATTIKEDINTFINDIFYAELDKILTGILKNTDKNRRYKIPKIEVEITAKNAAELTRKKEEISSKIRAQIVACFSINKDAQKDEVNGKNNNAQGDAFLYFLETGTNPWWHKIEHKNDWNNIETLLNEDHFVKKLKIKISKSICLDRIILNSDNKLLIKIVSKFLDEPKLVKAIKINDFSVLQDRTRRLAYFSALIRFSCHKDREKFIKDFKSIPLDFQSKNTQLEVKKLLIFTSNIISKISFLSEEKTASFLDEITSDFTIKKNLKKELKLVVSINDLETVSETKIKETEAYILNAGLIILHPFLNSLFEKLAILKKGVIVKKDVAVHLLHYLATKTEHPYEHQLTFEKYLCGIPQNYPINRFLKLSEKQKSECESLLTAVLQHWTALKTENTDVLRSEFLIREGKLTLTKEIEKVFIQRKAQDVLLDKIPWTIGLAKLPWKKELIYTEW